MITNLKDKIVFGVLITTVTKGYLKLTLSFMKTLSAEDETQESEDQQQQSWAPVIFLLLFTTIPLATLFFLLYNHSQLEKPKFKTMWGALYTNLSMSKAAQYTFNVWFMARRFVYAISIAGFFSSISMINVLLQILLSFFLLLYLFKVRPFDTPRDNHIEIVNEITIICSFYCTLGVITDDTYLTGEVKYAFGFGMIGLVLFNVVFNFTIFISNLVMQLITKIKAALQRHREKKAAKFLELQMERSINTLSHLTQEINMDKQKPSIYNITDEERAKMTLTQPKKDKNLMETQETLQLPKIVFQAETYNDFVQRKLKDKVKKGILNTGTIQGMSTDQLVAPRTRLDPISLIGKMAANGEAKLLQLSPLENDDFATKVNSGSHSQAQSYSTNDIKLSTPKHQSKQVEIQKLPEVKTNSPALSKQPLGLGRLGILNDKSLIIPNAFSLNEIPQQERSNSFKANQRPNIPQIQLMNNNVFGEVQRERAYSGTSLADRVKHENNNLLRVSFQTPL
ncbi:hypothetical protein FGO68_gene14557 [Halteria grandinella]|uniref:TRP C-terminal domain-containing protein n=1 Tax=Halteria grandinella TaxID=5974 RepID=A0A8J8SWQ6_HALGN|nr:hypothetical protein FGO68_gene14557 [Halteria grandinella]